MAMNVPAWRLEWLVGQLAQARVRPLPQLRRDQRAVWAAYMVGCFGSRRRRSVLKRAGRWAEVAYEMGKARRAS